MDIGLSLYDIAAPDLLELSRAADQAGFDAIWLGEHLVLPIDYASEHPTQPGDAHQQIAGPVVGAETELVDPLVALAAAAGATTRLRLATGIYILPLRHPLVTARAAATLQEASAGRFVMGIGSGWLAEEFAALDVAFAERWTRLDETIEVMRAAWAGGPFEHHGTHFSFDRIQLTRRPVHVPVIMGGNTEKALEKAARLGDGWFASGTPDIDVAVRLNDRMRALLADNGRDEGFRCYFRVADSDPEVLERYRSAGIDDVLVWATQLWPATGSYEAKLDALLAAADRIGLSTGAPA